MSARGVKSLITTLHHNPQLVDTHSTMQLHQHKSTKAERLFSWVKNVVQQLKVLKTLECLTDDPLHVSIGKLEFVRSHLLKKRCILCMTELNS